MKKAKQEKVFEKIALDPNIVPDEKMVFVAVSAISNLSKNNQNFLITALKKLHNEDISRILETDNRRIDIVELNNQLNENAAFLKAVQTAYGQIGKMKEIV